MSATKAVIEDDTPLPCHGTGHWLDVLSPSILKILLECLRIRQVATRWVPYHLNSPFNKIGKVLSFFSSMLQGLNQSWSTNVKNILTGDETWGYMTGSWNEASLWLFPLDFLLWNSNDLAMLVRKQIAARISCCFELVFFVVLFF